MPWPVLKYPTRLPFARFCLAACSLLASHARADNQWDISPYDVRVWVALDATPEVQIWKDRLPTLLDAELGLRCGAGWRVATVVAPAGIDRLLLDDIDGINAGSIEQHDAAALKADKLFFVQLRGTASQMVFAIRELDCQTRRVGPVLRGNILNDDRLATQLANTIIEAFSPIGLIGRAEDESVVVRMRAGILDSQRQTPIMPADGTMMHVVLRKSDRLGNPLPNGIELVPWTVLLAGPPPDVPDDVGQRRQLSLGTIHCEIVSGLRNPIRARGSRRVERFAFVVQPHGEGTTVELQTRGQPAAKLAGYDIYERLPGEKNTTLVGRSDWRGQLYIARDEHPLKILYVKNGGRLLARLPMVVGAEQQVTAELADDNLRLEAEGFLRGLQEEFVDLVARRKVLAMRVQRRIEDGKLEDAEKLVDEMRQLETRQDLERRIRERQATFQTRDQAQQDRINRLFRDTRSLLSKHLDPAEIDKLRDELAAAKSGK